MAEMLLAHGGTAGLVFEIAFLAVPVIVFTVMAVVSSRRKDADDAPADDQSGEVGP